MRTVRTLTLRWALCLYNLASPPHSPSEQPSPFQGGHTKAHRTWGVPGPRLGLDSQDVAALGVRLRSDSLHSLSVSAPVRLACSRGQGVCVRRRGHGVAPVLDRVLRAAWFSPCFCCECVPVVGRLWGLAQGCATVRVSVLVLSGDFGSVACLVDWRQPV